MSLCESNCEYTNYNTTNKKVYCNCTAKGSISSIIDIKDNTDILLTCFTDLKNAVNLDIMKCYKKFLIKEGIIKNIGSYILLTVIFIHFISLFLFIIKGYRVIYNIAINLSKTKEIKIDNKIKKSKIRNNIKPIKKSSPISIYHKEIKKNNNNPKISKYSLIYNIKNKSIKIHNPINRKRKIISFTKKLNEGYNSKSTNTKINLKYSEERIGKRIKKKFLFEKDYSHENLNKKENINKLKFKISNYNDYELNNLLYEEAKMVDNRTYFQFYISLLRQNIY
jgi:hypothetical protein